MESTRIKSVIMLFSLFFIVFILLNLRQIFIKEKQTKSSSKKFERSHTGHQPYNYYNVEKSTGYFDNQALKTRHHQIPNYRDSFDLNGINIANWKNDIANDRRYYDIGSSMGVRTYGRDIYNPNPDIHHIIPDERSTFIICFYYNYVTFLDKIKKFNFKQKILQYANRLSDKGLREKIIKNINEIADIYNTTVINSLGVEFNSIFNDPVIINKINRAYQLDMDNILNNTTKLSFRGFRLKHIPIDGIGCFKNVVEIDLSKTELKKGFEQLSIFRNLETIILESNKITQFPNFSKFSNSLKTVNLNNNSISSINLNSYKDKESSITHMFLSSNTIFIFSNNFYKIFPHLKILDLTDNNINSIPAELNEYDLSHTTINLK